MTKKIQFTSAEGSRVTIEAPEEKIDKLMSKYFPNVVIHEKVEKL